ncbi:HTH_48 domain-containing protein [Trichonephila clavipes]|nr:HTH_48 domain-containing protein [Trichonephila clavipes]
MWLVSTKPIMPVGSTASLSEHVQLHSARKMSNVKTEQRINIKSLLKLKKSVTETFQTLTETYGDKSLSRAWVFEWHESFSGGKYSEEDDALVGPPR